MSLNTTSITKLVVPLNVQGRTKCGRTFLPAVFRLPSILCFRRHLSETIRASLDCADVPVMQHVIWGVFLSHRPCNELQMFGENVRHVVALLSLL